LVSLRNICFLCNLQPPAAPFEESARQLAAWHLDGRLAYEEDVSDGTAHAPGALADLYAGRNQGKKLIYVG